MHALVDALESMEAGFARFALQLEAATVHEHAFGKLIDAAKVRDAYHDRLPATRVNLAEAAEVAREFVTEFAPPPADAKADDGPGAQPGAAEQDEQAQPMPPQSVPPQREAVE